MRYARFEQLFEAHASDLFAFLMYRTNDRALAEDIVADTFERAFRARRRFDPRRGSEKTWLYSIAVNRLTDLRRRAASERGATERLERDVRVAATPALEDAVLASEEVRSALASLSEEEREAIALRFGGDLSVPQVARVLGEPLSRVEGRLYRGLRKLRDILDT